MTGSARSRLLLFLIPVVTTIILVTTGPYWQGIDMKCYDFRVNITESLGIAKTASSGAVVLVGIEDDELLKNKPLIFWYPDIGRFLLAMKDGGARVVALDLIPVASLGERIAETARLLIGNELNGDRNAFLELLGEKTDNSLLGPMISVSDRITVIQGVAEGTVPFFYSSMAFMGNIHPASVRIEPDADHVMRRQKLSDGTIDTLSHAVYRALAGAPFPARQVTINYPLRKTIPYYTFSDVLRGKVPASAFQGKAVILGYINKYLDVQPTPVSHNMPGAQIHAITIETMLTGTGLTEATPTVLTAVILLLAGLGSFLSFRLSPMGGSACIAALSAGYLVINVAFFARGIVLPLVPPLIAPLAVFGAIFPYRYLVEEKSRRNLYRMFSYYIDRTFIDTLLEKGAEGLLKGEHKNVTIIFLDIREFTRFCENRPADQTVSFLNIFYDRMIGIIQQHNGVVNKIIGDALLVFFWDEKNGIDAALSASNEMLLATDQLGKDPSLSRLFEEWELKIGIAVHYGSVLMGNIGSEKKMDFTIIGTPVNVASRLEGLNKRLNTRLLVTEEAWLKSTKKIDLEFIGSHDIRGLKEPFALYTLREDADAMKHAEKSD